MADNTTLPGTGDVIADDDISAGVAAGAKVQRIKAGWGIDGTYVDAAVSTPLPVQTSVESSQMTMVGTVVTPQYVPINISANGDTTIIAAISGKVTRIIHYSLVCDGAVAVKFTSGPGGTALTGAMSFAANGGISATCEKGLFQTATNTALVLNLSGAVGVRGHLTCIQG